MSAMSGIHMCQQLIPVTESFVTAITTMVHQDYPLVLFVNLLLMLHQVPLLRERFCTLVTFIVPPFQMYRTIMLSQGVLLSKCHVADGALVLFCLVMYELLVSVQTT